jgi:hypothetical protein
MVMKKKKKRLNQSVVHYSDLFEKAKDKDFLDLIFSSNFIFRYSSHWNMMYGKVAVKLLQVRSYFHDDDLYQYFKINHLLNKDKSKKSYEDSLFKLVTSLSLHVYIDDDVNYLETNVSPEYIYGYELKSKLTPASISFARDYFYYGYDFEDLKAKYGLRYNYLIKKLKEIYQLELLPVDISQASYY